MRHCPSSFFPHYQTEQYSICASQVTMGSSLPPSLCQGLIYLGTRPLGAGLASAGSRDSPGHLISLGVGESAAQEVFTGKKYHETLLCSPPPGETKPRLCRFKCSARKPLPTLLYFPRVAKLKRGRSLQGTRT